jgi:hypothetical protein
VHTNNFGGIIYGKGIHVQSPRTAGPGPAHIYSQANTSTKSSSSLYSFMYQSFSKNSVFPSLQTAPAAKQSGNSGAFSARDCFVSVRRDKKQRNLFVFIGEFIYNKI